MRNEPMPVLFVGHGSPMNAIEENEFTRGWVDAARQLPGPRAILAISAHWYADGTYVTDNEKPPTIHDFGGFPDSLYRTRYPAPGSPALADRVKSLVRSVSVLPDGSRGLDHGTWVVLARMYPEADIPIVQLSVNYGLPGADHYRIGQELRPLRDEGVLIIGSGNIVHNLGLADGNAADEGFAWADEWRRLTNRLIISRDDDRLVEYQRLGAGARLAVPTPDHYWPLLYALGAADRTEQAVLFNDRCLFGSVSMTAVKMGG